MPNTKLICCLALVVLYFATGCGGQKDETSATSEKNTAKKDSLKKPEPEKTATPAKRPPIINITDTIGIKRTVLCIKDSAATIERVSLKMGDILGNKLATVIAKNKMKVAGPPMAWYTGTKAPYFFEAGVPVEKVQGKIPGKIIVKQVAADSVVVAHFYGPYSQLPVAYETLTDWLKERKKKPKGKPYEIYVGDPMDKDGKPIDPYKVQTDVVFPWQ
jgi:effector-binding domain-containing protein